MANNTFTKNYDDGVALTEAQLDAALQSLKPDLAQLTQITAGTTAGTFLESAGDGVTPTWGLPLDPKGPFAIRNYGISATASGGALTFALKSKALTDPSASDPVDISVSTNGSTSAAHRDLQVTAPLSIVIPSSATLGTVNTTATPVYLYAYGSSTIKLAISRSAGFDYGDQQSTTAIAASSDSGSVLYATAATTVVPRLLGFAIVARNSSLQWQNPTRVNVANNIGPNAAIDAYTRSTGASVANRGVAVSSGSALFTTTSTSYVDVTNLSVTIETSGRPVMVFCVSDGSADGHVAALYNGNNTNTYGIITRNGSAVGGSWATSASFYGGWSLPCTVLKVLDTPSAGSHTYKVQIKAAAGTAGLFYTKLVAYEL